MEPTMFIAPGPEMVLCRELTYEEDRPISMKYKALAEENDGYRLLYAQRAGSLIKKDNDVGSEIAPALETGFRELIIGVRPCNVHRVVGEVSDVEGGPGIFFLVHRSDVAFFAYVSDPGRKYHKS